MYRAIAARPPDSPPAVILPPESALWLSPATDTAPRRRDHHRQTIQEKGRRGWEKAVGWGKRSLGETAMFRDQTRIAPTWRARKFAAQKTEAGVAGSVLHRLPPLGRPRAERVREETRQESWLPLTAFTHQYPIENERVPRQE